MAKLKTLYVCKECQFSSAQWVGQCPECQAWNSLESQAPKGFLDPQDSGGKKSYLSKPLALEEISPEEAILETPIAELNSLLGRGFVKGSVTLLAGEPGIGKSTLSLQLALHMAPLYKTLLISSEESPKQVLMRAKRLGLHQDQQALRFLHEREFNDLIYVIEQEKPEFFIIDSLQMVQLSSLPNTNWGIGTPHQLRYICGELLQLCKNQGLTAILIAHLTKDGSIAGPKFLEHLVDTVLMFEQNKENLRVLSSLKNRFGPVDDIALFSMQEQGLVPFNNTATLFLEESFPQAICEGIVLTPIYQGNKGFLIEIQTLLVPAKASFPRIISNRLENALISRLIAVVEKHLKLNFSAYDVYVNVAGGLKVEDVGLELALLMALCSSYFQSPIPQKTLFSGEISLSGRIRKVSRLEKRAQMAKELGFSSFISPAFPPETATFPPSFLQSVSSIQEAVRLTFPQEGF